MKNNSTYSGLFFFIIIGMSVMSCADSQAPSRETVVVDTVISVQTLPDTAIEKPVSTKPESLIRDVNQQVIYPDSLVAFARTLIGIPYLYASTDPAKGFDCSGFITYVFNHFNRPVPRSSVDFTDYGKEITLGESKPGDLILFTGTDSTIRIVGHMGIIESRRNDTLYFIHSTSGKAKGVVITPFGNYYESRFVKLIRVFPDELFK